MRVWLEDGSCEAASVRILSGVFAILLGDGVIWGQLAKSLVAHAHCVLRE